jgi:hypothetical protein
MLLRNLFEAATNEVAIIFGRFNPPHKGHRAAWELASRSPVWFVGTNRDTVGPKDPLPFNVKIEAMKTVWPEVEGHIVAETSWLTLASRVYEKFPDAELLCFTDEDWVTKTIVQYNGKEGAHGFYKFRNIIQKPTPRLSSATALRDAVSKDDRAAFSQAAGVDADTKIAGTTFFDLVAKYLLPYANVPKKVPAKKKKEPAATEGKKPEHNLGVGWMLDKDKQLGQKVAQNKARSRQERQTMLKYAGKKDLGKKQGVAEDYSNTTFRTERRRLNVPALIKAGALFVTYPHGEQGWETDNKEDWAYSLISLYNVIQGGWTSEAKKYLKPASYKKAEQQVNSSAPNLGSDKLVYDGKYNQILWSIKKLGIPDNVAFLDDSKQGVAESEKQSKSREMDLDRHYKNIINTKGLSDKAKKDTTDIYNKLKKNKEQGVAEAGSNAMSDTAKRLANKDDGKVAKLRAAGDKRREDQLKGRNIAKRNESVDLKTSLQELSNDMLGKYKKAASADASKADKEGNVKRGDKRFSGIVKATNKQFANDAKKTK